VISTAQHVKDDDRPKAVRNDHKRPGISPQRIPGTIADPLRQHGLAKQVATHAPVELAHTRRHANRWQSNPASEVQRTHGAGQPNQEAVRRCLASRDAQRRVDRGHVPIVVITAVALWHVHRRLDDIREVRHVRGHRRATGEQDLVMRRKPVCQGDLPGGTADKRSRRL